MKIIVCGAGEVGTHAAERLAANGHRVIVIDLAASRLRDIEETLDVATMLGSCTDARILREAGCEDADMLIAATDSDQVNLLSASMAKGIGARKSVARVHDAAFYEQQGLNYGKHFGIDRLICPEHATAMAIARKLRNPGAVAIESFARGRIEMQEFTAREGGSALGMRLQDVRLPPGSRLALLRRDGKAYIPEAKSVIVPGDAIILVGNADVFDDARKLFYPDKQPKKRIVLMGGGPMAIWLSRALRDRSFAIRLFERNRLHAEELAEELSWVTVIEGDPTNRGIFEEERIAQADVFVALMDNDEANIIAGVLAKVRGVETVITVVQRSKYLDLVFDIGVDYAYSTRQVAGEEIDQMIDDRPLRQIGNLAEGAVDVYLARVAPTASAASQPLKSLGLSPNWVVAAVQREREAFVPQADDVVRAGDELLLVGRDGYEDALHKLFGSG